MFIRVEVYSQSHIIPCFIYAYYDSKSVPIYVGLLISPLNSDIHPINSIRVFQHGIDKVRYEQPLV